MRLLCGGWPDRSLMLSAISERGMHAARQEVFISLVSILQGRSVHTYNMLVETRYLCNPVKSADSVFTALDNKLIYLSGKLSTSGPVTDGLYGVTGTLISPFSCSVKSIKWHGNYF